MPRLRACADCGEQRPVGPGSLPDGKYRCHGCRRSSRNPRPNTCQECGSPAVRVYCSKRCANIVSNRARQIRSADDGRVRRRQRVADAPGLTEYGIRKLAERWALQERTCTYCGARATTADHVLPLVRGGTNYEGNLTPCCKACNSRKSGYTVIEWRTGLRLAAMSSTLDAMGRRRPPRQSSIL